MSGFTRNLDKKLTRHSARGASPSHSSYDVTVIGLMPYWPAGDCSSTADWRNALRGSRLEVLLTSGPVLVGSLD
jgi:hypothetical protein